MCLANNVVEHGVYHAFAVGATVPGPKVFMNMTADGRLGLRAAPAVVDRRVVRELQRADGTTSR